MSKTVFNISGRFGLDIAGFKTKLEMAEKNLSSFKARVKRSTDSARKAFQSITKAVSGVQLAVGALAGGITVAGFAAMTKGALQAADEINKLAMTTNSTAEEIQALSIAFKNFGLEGDDVGDVLNTLADRVQDAKDGTQSFIDDFKLIGIEVSSLEGKRPAELFDVLAEAVANTQDPIKRQAAIVRILGDDIGRKLAPALLEGKEGFNKLKREAMESGAIMSNATVKGAADANRALSSLQTLVMGGINTALAQMAPVIRVVVDELKSFLKLGSPSEFKIVPIVQKIIKGFGYMGDAIRGVQIFIQGLVVGFSTLKAVGMATINTIINGLNYIPGVDIALFNEEDLQRQVQNVRNATNDLKSLMEQSLPSQKADEFNAKIDAMIVKYQELGNQATETGKTIGTVIEGWDDDAKEFGATIQKTLGDELYQALSGNFESVGSAFKSLITRMVADAMAADIAKFIGLPGSSENKGGGNGFIKGAASFVGSFFADGGRPPVGVPSMVGERGKELFVPDEPGTIIPNNKLNNIGGQTVNNVSITVNTKDAESFKSSRGRIIAQMRNL